jgi:hypothetical protein
MRVHFFVRGNEVYTDDHYPPHDDGKILVMLGNGMSPDQPGYLWLKAHQWSKEPKDATRATWWHKAPMIMWENFTTNDIETWPAGTSPIGLDG